MLIFSTDGKLTPNDDKTNIKIPFTVPSGTNSLVVKYSYSPKTVEDKTLAMKAVAGAMEKYRVNFADAQAFFPVNNLVTLSFDECGKYRGACHRQPNEQTVVIAPSNSTPGIFNRELSAGEWCVVLNAHFIGCDIDYSISIEGEVD
jgi:hypothetical protein